MLTGKDEQFERDEGLGLGAHVYITKPYDSYLLLREINNLLGKKKRGAL
jgi:DNA-binding response OmpR family regulator